MKTSPPSTLAVPPTSGSPWRPLLRSVALLAALGLAQAPSARAQSPSPSTPHSVPSSLQTQVTSLTSAASTQQQKLRAATLQWALTQAAYLFSTTTDRTDSPPTTIDPTASFYPGDTTVTQAPSGVTSGTTYDLRFSPFGLGDGLVRDVSNNLASNTQIGNPNTTKFPYGSGGYNLSPAMPSWPPGGTFTNPLAQQAAGTASNFEPVNGGQTGASVFDLNDDEVALVEVFTHPDFANYPTSPAGTAVYGNPGLVNVVFDSIEYYNEQGCLHVGPDIKQSISGSFEDSINYYLPYLLVKARFPDLILPSMQTWWEASIYRMLTFDYNYDISGADPNAAGVPPASENGQFLQPYTDNAYPNNDFRRMEGMFYASILFQNSTTYPNVTANIRRGIYNYLPVVNSPAVVYGDGAITYGYHANGLLQYQNSSNTPLSNMFVVLKGSTVAADVSARSTIGTMLQKCWIYYPEQWVASGYHEDVALTPSWKEPGDIQGQGYEFHGHLPCFNPEFASSAYPQVWRIYYENGILHEDSFGTLSAAAFDPSRDPFKGNGSLAAAYDPDDYFGYDQNLVGPTSRFGTWQMFGSARPELTNSRGPGSVMSFYLHDPANGAKDEAALNRASAAVWTSATSESTGSINDGIDSTIVTPIFASVVTQSSIGGTGFQQEQEWLYTPSRVVGMTTVTVPSSGAISAYAIGADVSCLYSTGVANTNTNPTYLYAPDDSGNGTYRLTINVVHNGFGYSASDTSGLRLYDSANVAGTSLHSYVVGDHGYSLVDIHPTPAGNATVLESISTGMAGVYGLEVADANGRYRLIHNTTASAVTYNAYLPTGDWGTGSVLVHHAETPAVYGSSTVPDRPEIVGETYRPAWMNSSDRSSISAVTPTYYQLSSNNFSYSVPAHSHIVIANVPGVVDGGIYELEPRSSPGSRLDVSGAGTANGTPLDLYSRNGYINQLWQAQSQGNGVFRFLTLDSTSYLDVTNDGSANGTQVVIATDGTTPGKQWTPLLQTNGSLAFRPGSASGSLLDADASYSPVRIDISTATYGSSQEFNLIRTNPVLGVGPVPSE